MSDHTQSYFREVQEVARGIDLREIDCMIDILAEARSKGRLLSLGVGGGAGHAGHAVNDFRKLCRSRPMPPPTTFPN